ncbi:MAG: terminase [Desulfovibrio sp.]
MADHPLTFLTEHYFDDPYGFVMDLFPWGKGMLSGSDGPDQWQKEVLEQLGQGSLSPLRATMFAVSSGHGIGKSALIAWIILWFMSTRPHPQVVCTANTKPQLETKTWRELAKWHKLFEYGSLFKWSTGKFALKEASETWFSAAIPWSEHNSEAFAGTHEQHVLVVFDEASKIADVIWDVVQGAMTTPGAMWVAFGNPTQNTGRFAECFRRYRHRWLNKKVDSRTCKMTNKEEIAGWVEDWGEDSDFVRVRVRGEFPRSGSMQFIAEDTVEEAMKRKVNQSECDYAPRVLGVDVARFGDDQSVIVRRQGNYVWPLTPFKGMDTMTLASRVAEEIDVFSPEAVFVDGVGIGAGVVDRLRQLGFQVVDVQSGSKATKPVYANLRAEMWANMREWLDMGGALPDSLELRDDLTGVQYGYNMSGAVQLERKEDMKKRGLASPDSADALALTFAYPVNRRRGVMKQTSYLQK